MGERRTALIIGIVVAVVLVGFSAWTLTSGVTSQPDVKLTEITDPAELQKRIGLDHISIATSENFAGQRIRLIYGVLKNLSDKPIRMVEVKMVFQDYDGKPIQEHTPRTFDPKMKPLAPGEEFRFEVGFENLPKDWNYRVPVAEVARIGY